LKLPSLLVWNSISSAALHVLVMSELNVMWLDRSSCGLSVYAWLFGVGCLLCLLLCWVGLGAVFLLFVSRASRYGFSIFG
jgi:membrane protein YqaA with SNARE-associated domain